MSGFKSAGSSPLVVRSPLAGGLVAGAAALSRSLNSSPARARRSPNASLLDVSATTLEHQARLHDIVEELDHHTLCGIIQELHTEIPDSMDISMEFLRVAGYLKRGDAGTGSAAGGRLRRTASAEALSEVAVMGSEAEDRSRAHTVSNPILRRRSSSQLGGHHFKVKTFRSSTKCSVCKKMLRGLFRQGQMCSACGMSVHGRCKSRAPPCPAAPDPSQFKHSRCRENPAH